MECFCVTSRPPLPETQKVPPPFHVGVRYCGGLILASQWPCSLSPSRQSFIYRSDSARPGLCASWPFLLLLLLLFRERERKLIWTPSSSSALGPSIRLSGGPSVRLPVNAPPRLPIFPSRPRVYPPLTLFVFISPPVVPQKAASSLSSSSLPPPAPPRSGADSTVKL